MPSGVEVTATFTLPDPHGRAAEDFRNWVARKGGTFAGEPQVRPIASDLLRLPIGYKDKDGIIGALMKKVDTIDELTGRTEAQVLKFKGIGWPYYLVLVRALSELGLRLKGAPEFGDMIELLDIPRSLYLELRSSERTDRSFWIPPHQTFRQIPEITDLDHIGLIRILGTFAAKKLVDELELAGHHVAPSFPERTVRDLYTTPVENLSAGFQVLIAGGVAPDMKLADITEEYLISLAGKVSKPEYVVYLGNLLSKIGIRLADSAARVALIQAVNARRHELDLAAAQSLDL